ncbi:MAG: LAGLIDADG family homing endonuclease [Candidatus Paceibacterota bacterium]
MRHSPQIIQDIIQMRKDGFTLGEIMAETSLSKTTIHHHIKSIPKSNFLLKKILAKTLVAQKRQAELRRGKSIKTYKFKRPQKWTIELVSLVAHFLFDGQIRRTSCIYYNRSEALRKNIVDCMQEKLGVADYKIYETSGGVKRVCYFNVELAAFVRQKADELLNHIGSAAKNHKLSFLKSFFDDEGCITFSSKKRLIRGYQHSLVTLRLIQNLLADFQIESRIDGKYGEIYISRKPNLIKFQKYINFTPGVCVNGNRSNSIWKNSLEKREILNRALASYRF